MQRYIAAALVAGMTPSGAWDTLVTTDLCSILAAFSSSGLILY